MALKLNRPTFAHDAPAPADKQVSKINGIDVHAVTGLTEDEVCTAIVMTRVKDVYPPP